MNFNNVNDLKNAGFAGFKTMRELFIDSSQLPDVKGIYVVLHLNESTPNFLQAGSGGHFKGRNPNVSLTDLTSNWIAKTPVVYIGKAGSGDGRATLKSRLRQYLRFGQGKNVGHWGGRLIWQIASSDDLVICWKALPNEDPRFVEAQMIKQFCEKFGGRPFANLAD